MSRVVFLGSVAGTEKAVHVLHDAQTRRRTLAGDANAIYNYVLFCGCDEGRTELGVVARFTANKDGHRSAACPKCKNVTILDKNLQVVKVLPLAKVLERIAPAGAQ